MDLNLLNTIKKYNNLALGLFQFIKSHSSILSTNAYSSSTVTIANHAKSRDTKSKNMRKDCRTCL